MVQLIPDDVTVVAVHQSLNEKVRDSLEDILGLWIIFLAKAGLHHPKKRFVEMLRFQQNCNFRGLVYLEILRFEALEAAVICSSLLDQGYTQIELVQIVQNFINPGDNLAAMNLESFMDLLTSKIIFQPWIQVWKDMYNFLV